MNPEDRSLGRRAFLASGATIVAGLTLSPDVASAALARPELRTPAARKGPDIEEATFSDLADGMTNGRWSSRDLVEAYIERINAIDRDGPVLNTILELNPDALAIAEALDAERAERGPRSALHGIPILVKDDIGTKDRMHTSAGSLALATSISPRDAHVIARLRDAGCVVLGKSNMSEWANARGRGSAGGWSGRARLSRNPYALDRSTGGSSSGTAAAVSANLVAGAIGTEAMGSIMSPASLCGVVGLKPTVGLVSRAGIISVSESQETAGPICRTVRDAAMLLSVIAGVDPADPATAAATGRIEQDYAKFLDPKALTGARIGVARNYWGLSLPADRVASAAIEVMRGAGATIVDPVVIETADAILPFDAELLSYEIKAGINQYLASLGTQAPVKSLAELIEFNDRNADREMERFGQDTFLYAQTKGPLSSPEYQNVLNTVRLMARTQGIDATMQKHKLDAIVAPAQSPAWLTDVLLGDNSTLMSYLPSSAAGYPSITVPAGDVAGLPVGLLFMGSAWSEAKLISLAFAFEQRVQQRRMPQFLASANVKT